MEVGILLGQNANVLLPTGGTDEHKVDGLRIRHTVLGEYSYVLDGYHPEIWRPTVTTVEAWSKAVGILLRHRWNPVGDTFTFLMRTFLPEVFLRNKDTNEMFEWTKAVILSTVALMFDPAGLISAYTIKFKLFLCETCLGEEITWTDPLPPNLMERWRSMTEELVCTPPITINQSARPPKAQGKPRLVAFSDGSSVAYAAAVCVIYRVPKIVTSLSHSTLPKDTASLSLRCDDSYEARLLLSKVQS